MWAHPNGRGMPPFGACAKQSWIGRRTLIGCILRCHADCGVQGGFLLVRQGWRWHHHNQGARYVSFHIRHLPEARTHDTVCASHLKLAALVLTCPCAFVHSKTYGFTALHLLIVHQWGCLSARLPELCGKLMVSLLRCVVEMRLLCAWKSKLLLCLLLQALSCALWARTPLRLSCKTW